MNSSFQISRRGAREKVKANLATEIALPKEGDQSQIEAVKVYLVTLIDGLPKDFNAVAVVVNGEVSDNRIVLHTCVVQGEKNPDL